MKPLLTILTVVFNDITIEQTIKSVIPFLSKEVEYVLIDGASTDDTLSIIEKYRSYFSFFLSETDKGIYDAINKGVKFSRGDFILHVNAGDFLLNLPLDELYKERYNENVAALSFPVIMNSDKFFYPCINWKIKFKNTLHHQGTFYRRNIDHYDITYRVFADADLNKRLYKCKYVIKTYTFPYIANHLWNGISTKTKNRHELYLVIIKNYGYFYLLFHFFYRLLDLFCGRNNKM